MDFDPSKPQYHAMVWDILFWFCIGWLVYVYMGYPLVLAVLALLTRRTYRSDPDYQPSVSILFSAKDEISALPEKLANLRALDYPGDKIKILAASDGSRDGTSEYLSGQNDIHTLILNESIGKNAALNRLLPSATGEILFFTDANTQFDLSAIRAVVALFADPRVGCVTGELRFSSRGSLDSVGRGTGLYWRYENAIKRLESAIGSVLVAAGSLLAVKRERCTELFPDVANDFQLPMMIGSSGDAVLYSGAFLGKERAASDLKDEFERTVRIVARGICGCRRLWSALLIRPFRLWQLLSHKVMRWLVGPILLLLMLSTVVLLDGRFSRIYWGASVGQLIFYGAAFLGGAIHAAGYSAGPLYVPYHFLALNMAALVGMVRGVFHGAPSVWEKPVSARD